MEDIFGFARKTISEVNNKDRNNMAILYNSFSTDEKIFISEFMQRCGSYKNDIIYNEKSGCINVRYKNMQIGRIRINGKKRTMQILTMDTVVWLKDITLEEAINNIDKWLKYLEELVKIK